MLFGGTFFVGFDDNIINDRKIAWLVRGVVISSFCIFDRYNYSMYSGRKYYLIFLLLVFSGQARGEYYFEYSPLVKQAYGKLISLELEEGRVLVDSVKQMEPENLSVYHIENYIDFFTIFINEEKDEFERLENNKNLRLDKIRQGPKDSPYYLFCQAEIQLQWALSRLKFEEYFTAFSEINKSYKQLENNLELFPAFKGSLKSLGVIHAIVGTVPDNYRWGLKLIGRLDGTIAQGKLELEEVIEYSEQQNFIFKEEAIVSYAFLLLHLENNSDLAWETISKAKLNTKQNPLACFVIANMALRSGRCETALKVLQQRPRGNQYLPFYYLDLLQGYALLYKLDPSADYFIERYLNNYRGVNMIKDAYQKLAWYFLINGNSIAYKNNMRLCQIRGNTLVDSDKNAMKEAQNVAIPNSTLLKARLLFDGGYYQRAKEMLDAEPVSSYKEEQHRLEYAYRKGRVNHALRNYSDAISNYSYSITNGADRPYFYACNAALQCGIIYEKFTDYERARHYYTLCTELSPSDYKNSLHQKAEAGLNRISGKKMKD